MIFYRVVTDKGPVRGHDMQKMSFVRTSQVYLMFTASGATALIYQVIWSRWLGLVFGNTTTSISIVLGCFMMGLALGSWGAGRLLRRIGNPMRAYAFLELGIGIFALCFPFLSRLTDVLFTMAVGPGSPAAFSVSVRALLSFLLLIVPTTLMGATLPFLTDFFRRSPRHTRSWKVGLLYAANTLGAAAGIVLASFLLIELLGVFVTTLLAAALNLIIAVIGFRFSFSGVAPGDDPWTVKQKEAGPMGKLAVFLLAASGAIALASEILWTRVLETLVGNSTYAFSMIVLLYLVGIAAGSWLASLMVNRITRLPVWITLAQVCMGIWIFIALFLLEGIISSVSQYRGEMVSLAVLFGNFFKVMIVLLPLSLLSGACFPLATRLIDPDSEDARGTLISRAYAWNTMGAVAGSLAAGFIIAPRFDYFDALYLLAFLYCLTAFAASLIIIRAEWQTAQKRMLTLAACAASLVMGGAALFSMSGAGHFATRFDTAHPLFQVVYHRPGLQGVTTVIRKRDEPTANILLVNGMGMTIKVTDTKMMAHLPMLLHPAPKDTLVICFGMGTTYRSAVAHGGNVTVVELVQEVLDAFDFFYQDASRVRTYAQGKMVANDGRNFLKLARTQYDVITIDPPPPIDAAGVTHLYSREFLDLARTRLKKGGIMAHWIPFPGTKSGIDDWETFRMLVQTFADVFPHVYMQRGYHGIGLHILGTLEPLDMSMDLLNERLRMQSVRDDINEWDAVPFTYFQGIQPYHFLSVSEEVVTDDRPRLEFYLLRTLQQNGKKMFAFSYW